MSSSEIAFLAVGLVLGATAGAAFLAAAWSRSAVRREVRVTIAPNSIGPRRAATLSELPAVRDHLPPFCSPDDAAWPDRPLVVPAPAAVEALPGATAGAPMRTRVPDAAPAVASARVLSTTTVAIDVSRETDAGIDLPVHRSGWPGRAAGSARLTATPAGSRVAVAGRPTAVATLDTWTMAAALDAGWSRERVVRLRPRVGPARTTLTGAAVGMSVARAADDPDGETGQSPAVGAGSVEPAPVSSPAAADPCGSPRALVERQCAEAATARERARTAASAAREAQRSFDVLEEKVARAREQCDPRAVAAAKAAMREQFRAEDRAAATLDDSEAAARRWLQGINQANDDARAAQRVLETGTAEMRERQAAVGRLALDADAARIAADGADDTCRIARDELARCEEDAAAAAAARFAPDPDPFEGVWPTQQDVTSIRTPPGVPGDALAGQSAILRLVLGDRSARDRVVAAVAGSDPAAVATWQIRITALSDAIIARAIEAGYLVLPEDHPFWGLFSGREQREIVGALAALGFRFDGLGGFADGRVPAARDLSLAVGYAGLDRMRIRRWPQEGEIAGLYAQAVVAADEWLVWVTRDLELGPLTGALGPRAAGLDAIWDAWGRVRPALLATD